MFIERSPEIKYLERIPLIFTAYNQPENGTLDKSCIYLENVKCYVRLSVSGLTAGGLAFILYRNSGIRSCQKTGSVGFGLQNLVVVCGLIGCLNFLTVLVCKNGFENTFVTSSVVRCSKLMGLRYLEVFKLE